MKSRDFRKLSPNVQKEIREIAVRAVLEGETQEQAAQLVGVSRQSVNGWMKNYRGRGQQALGGKKRGRRTGEKTRLTNKQCEKIKSWLKDTTPEQLSFAFALWTRRSIQVLIEEKLGIKLPLTTISEYLKRWGFTAQRPKKRAIEQQPEAVKKWLKHTYPDIEIYARKEGSEIHWGDEMGLRSNANYGRSYAPKGKTPTMETSAKHLCINVISTVTNKGQLRFMLYSESFTAKVFLTFLRRLIKGARKKILLIVDNLRVHHAKIVQEWLKENKSTIELRFLPPYAPEYNPDEYLNNTLKRSVASKRFPKTADELKSNVRSALSHLQKMPTKIMSLFRAPSVRYAAA